MGLFDFKFLLQLFARPSPKSPYVDTSKVGCLKDEQGVCADTDHEYDFIIIGGGWQTAIVPQFV